MAFNTKTPTQLEAANKLFQRGLNVDGTPLSDQQKQSITGLQAQGLDPAQTLLAPPQPGALARFGAGAASPTLGLLQTIQQQGRLLPQIGATPRGIDIAALRQRMPQPTGVAGTLGQIAGFAPLAAAPEAAARSLPTLLGRLVARGLGQGAVGGLTSPESPKLGTALGAGLGAGLSALAPLGRGLFGTKMAGKLAQTTLDEISGKFHSATPATAIQDNAQSAATQIRDLHTDLIKDYEGQIGDVMNTHGNTVINTPQFDELKEDITKLGKRSSKKSLATFEKEPNLLNAHNLQSTIGSDTRSVTPKNRQDVSDIEDLNEARNALKGDINDSLDRVDPSGETSKKYVGASNFFRDHIVPFDERPGLKDIATGETTTPDNLTKIFKNPSKGILGILNKLPDSFRNKVLYETLGRNQKTINPRRLVTAIDALDHKGLAQHYLPEDIANARDVIERNIGREKGVLPEIIKGGLIRIPQWLIAGTAFKLAFGDKAFRGEE